MLNTVDEECRSILEDVRLKNAKERLKERKKLQDEDATQSQELKDIKETAMKKDDFSKLGTLFVQYRQVYSDEKGGRV